MLWTPNQTLTRYVMESRKSKVGRDRKRIAEDLARAKLVQMELDEAMAAIAVNREINALASVAVKEVRLQLEQQRIVLVWWLWSKNHDTDCQRWPLIASHRE